MPRRASLSLPPLRDGDRLTSDEFMRRWEAMPDLKNAELIDGIVYLTPLVTRQHSKFHASLTGWLGNYAAYTPMHSGGIKGTWLMDEQNVPQPDIAFHLLPEYGGQSRVKGEYAAGAPELIIEIAVSRQSRDHGPKLKLYERMGVREYLIALPGEKELVWNELVDGRYRPRWPDVADGVFRSPLFPGSGLILKHCGKPI